MKSGEESRSSSGVIAITSLGTGLLLVCLCWVRIALGGPHGVAPPWVAMMSAPAEALLEAVSGPFIADSGTDQSIRLGRWHALWVPACLLYATSAWLVLRGKIRDRHLEVELILAFAVVFRLVLVPSPPLLETDPNRYLWDGATLSHGVDPYRHSPLEVLQYRLGIFRPDDPRDDRELALLAKLSTEPALAGAFHGINHPVVPTLYPPMAQVLFALASRAAPGNVRVLKLLLIGFDLGVLWLMLELLARTGRPRTWALLYGWCPLVLKEYACSGHYDPMATFFLMACVLASFQGRPGFAGVLGGLAVSSKLFPLVILFLLMRRLGRRGLVAAGATTFLLHLPVLAGGMRDLDGLLTYSTAWTGNASLFALLQAILEGRAARILVCLAAVAGTCLILPMEDLTEAGTLRKVLTGLGLVFILSPVQNPWYLGWVLPWAILERRISWVVLALTSNVYYAYFTAGTYVVAGMDLRWLEYLPFYGLLLMEARDQKA